MSDFYYDVVLPIAVIAAMLFAAFLIAFGLYAANAYWNCAAWQEQTGDEVRMIAGDCYVRSGNRWELFSTYVRNHHIEVKE